MPELGAPNLPVALPIKGFNKWPIESLYGASFGEFNRDRLCRIDGLLVLGEILIDIVGYAISQLDGTWEARHSAVILTYEFQLTEDFFPRITKAIWKHAERFPVNVRVFEATVDSLVVGSHRELRSFQGDGFVGCRQLPDG